MILTFSFGAWAGAMTLPDLHPPPVSDWNPDRSAPLDPKALAGLVLMADLTSTTLTEASQTFLNTVRPGFLLVFEYNLVEGPRGPAALSNLTRDVSNYCEGRGFQGPLWAVDQEGGRVSRLGPPFAFPAYPSPALVAAAGHDAGAQVVWAHMAETMASCGIGVNLAPCLDLSRWQSAPLLSLRCFGSTPQQVVPWGRLFARVMAQRGIWAVAKHVPGHGAAAADSHASLPRVELSPEIWYRQHLRPFIESVWWGVDGLMVAHLEAPQWESSLGRPISLSSAVNTGLIRDQLGFPGLVFTDSLCMGAITNGRGMELACEEALRSGADVLLVPHGYQEVTRIHSYLVRRMEEDPTLEACARRSARRILSRRARPAPTRPEPVSPAAFAAQLFEMERVVALRLENQLKSLGPEVCFVDLRPAARAQVKNEAPKPPAGATAVFILPDLPEGPLTRDAVAKLAAPLPKSLALTRGDPVAWENLGFTAIFSSFGQPLGLSLFERVETRTLNTLNRQPLKVK
jgi:beta-N-acetylhexosaminidase